MSPRKRWSGKAWGKAIKAWALTAHMLAPPSFLACPLAVHFALPFHLSCLAPRVAPIHPVPTSCPSWTLLPRRPRQPARNETGPGQVATHVDDARYALFAVLALTA